MLATIDSHFNLVRPHQHGIANKKKTHLLTRDNRKQQKRLYCFWDGAGKIFSQEWKHMRVTQLIVLLISFQL